MASTGSHPTGTDRSALSAWWKAAVILVAIFGFTVLVMMSARAYKDAPPIPKQVVGPSGEVLFTKNDIEGGQEVFLKYGLMDNGTIWGHGAYLGPDFSAAYLHNLSDDVAAPLARQRFNKSVEGLSSAERQSLNQDVAVTLQKNRYDDTAGTLEFTQAEADSYRRQIGVWTAYFVTPKSDGGLPATYISDPGEMKDLTAFFAWAAWATTARRPGKDYSYTSNFPYDPAVGNKPSTEAILWSALSLIGLLGGTAAVLFIFGRFNYLGWKGESGRVLPTAFAGWRYAWATGHHQVLPHCSAADAGAGAGWGCRCPLPRRSRNVLRH